MPDPGTDRSPKAGLPPSTEDRPRQSTRQVKSRRWRLGHSLWLLWLVPLGFTSFLAFAYIGARKRQPLWLIYSAVYAIAPVLYLFQGPLVGRGIAAKTTFFIVWPLAAVHACVVRSDYLRRLAGLTSAPDRRWLWLRSRYGTRHLAAIVASVLVTIACYEAFQTFGEERDPPYDLDANIIVYFPAHTVPALPTRVQIFVSMTAGCTGNADVSVLIRSPHPIMVSDPSSAQPHMQVTLFDEHASIQGLRANGAEISHYNDLTTAIFYPLPSKKPTRTLADFSFRAGWISQRGYGSCYVMLPDAVLGKGSRVTGGTEYINVESNPNIVDPASSVPAPEGNSAGASWKCPLEPDDEGVAQLFTPRRCTAGYGAFNEPGAGQSAARGSFLAASLIGVALAIGAELVLRPLLDGRDKRDSSESV